MNLACAVENLARRNLDTWSFLTMYLMDQFIHVYFGMSLHCCLKIWNRICGCNNCSVPIQKGVDRRMPYLTTLTRFIFSTLTYTHRLLQIRNILFNIEEHLLIVIYACTLVVLLLYGAYQMGWLKVSCLIIGRFIYYFKYDRYLAMRYSLFISYFMLRWDRKFFFFFAMSIFFSLYRLFHMGTVIALMGLNDKQWVARRMKIKHRVSMATSATDVWKIFCHLFQYCVTMMVSAIVWANRCTAFKESDNKFGWDIHSIDFNGILCFIFIDIWFGFTMGLIN